MITGRRKEEKIKRIGIGQSFKMHLKEISRVWTPENFFREKSAFHHRDGRRTKWRVDSFWMLVVVGESCFPAKNATLLIGRNSLLVLESLALTLSMVSEGSTLEGDGLSGQKS